MKKIPWYEFPDSDVPDNEIENLMKIFDDYIKEYGTQELYELAYKHGNHDNMMLGGLGWDPPPIMGPYTFLSEYCRINGFQTEDNRYICRTCGTKNEVSDTGTRFCKKCTEVPTVDLGFGRSED